MIRRFDIDVTAILLLYFFTHIGTDIARPCFA